MSKSKGFIVLILLILVTLTPVCANEIFSLSTGVNISYLQDMTSLEKFEFDKKNLAIGLEARSNLTYLQVTAVGEISVLDSDTLKLAGILSAGFSVEVFNFFKLGVTAGPRMAYIYSKPSSRVKTAQEAEETELSNGKDFIESFKEGPFNIRFMLDIMTGPVMSIGAVYTIPTDFTLEMGNWEALLPSSESIKRGQISLSIQMKLF